MTGMEVTAEELQSLLVDQLEVIDEAAFEKARAMATGSPAFATAVLSSTPS